MRSQNTIELNFETSPQLAAIFANKKPGDKCTFEITMQVGEINEQRVKGPIEKIASDYDDEDEKVAEPSPEEPMTVKINAMPMPMSA